MLGAGPPGGVSHADTALRLPLVPRERARCAFSPRAQPRCGRVLVGCLGSSPFRNSMPKSPSSEQIPLK